MATFRRIRVIPVLLIQKKGLVKSIGFKGHTYVGDPINAVKIFNDKEVDEIIVLDISATPEKRGPDFERITEITSEAFMPLGYGGGITTIDQVKRLIQSGVEKVVIRSAAFSNPSLIEEAAKIIGSQSVVVCIDIKQNWLGKPKVITPDANKLGPDDAIEVAKKIEYLGAGELILQSVNRDGTYKGYDLPLIQSVTSVVSIPVVALGGASQVHDFTEAISAGASAVAAGSMFVFQRPHRAVLISYPNQQILKEKLFIQV